MTDSRGSNRSRARSATRRAFSNTRERQREREGGRGTGTGWSDRSYGGDCTIRCTSTPIVAGGPRHECTRAGADAVPPLDRCADRGHVIWSSGARSSGGAFVPAVVRLRRGQHAQPNKHEFIHMPHACSGYATALASCAGRLLLGSGPLPHGLRLLSPSPSQVLLRRLFARESSWQLEQPQPAQPKVRIAWPQQSWDIVSAAVQQHSSSISGTAR